MADATTLVGEQTQLPYSPAEAELIGGLKALDQAAPTLNDELWRKAIVLLDPECRAEYREQFRQLRNRLVLYRDQVAGGAPLQVIAFLSAARGDGKSFTSGNLAAALALAAKGKVLLLDADPTSGRWHRRLEIDGDFGLSEVLAGGRWEDAVFPAPGLDLDLMPLGTARSSAIDRLDFHRLPAVLAELRARYEWIIVDGPSFEDSADAELLGNLADGAMLVVKQDTVPFQKLQGFQKCLPEGKLLGVILNPGRG